MSYPLVPLAPDSLADQWGKLLGVRRLVLLRTAPFVSFWLAAKLH
jgi:hypothetical protein